MAKKKAAQYRYWPSYIDMTCPCVIKGEEIVRGSVVTITRKEVDPMGKFVFIKDEKGNIQSVYKTALEKI